MGQVAEKYKIPVLVVLATHPDITKISGYVDQSCFDNVLQGKLSALYVRDELRIEKAAVFISS